MALNLFARKPQSVADLRGSKWFIPGEEVQVLERIGAGASGQVYMGSFRQRDVALKQFYCQMMVSEDVADFTREFNVLAALDHPGIVKMLGVTQVGDFMYLVTEYCPIQVEKYVQQQAPVMQGESVDNTGNASTTTFAAAAGHRDSGPWLRLLRAVHICLDVARAMAYLHSKRFVHRDIKPSNILMTEDGVVKLCDFGASRAFEQRLFSPKVRTGSRRRVVSIEVGTPPYMAPELFPRNATQQDYEANDGKILARIDSFKTDVYAFGTTMWALLCGREPFANLSRGEIQEIVQGRGVRPAIPAEWPPSLQAIVRTCWQQQPEHRPSFHELVRALEVFVDNRLHLQHDDLSLIHI